MLYHGDIDESFVVRFARRTVVGLDLKDKEGLERRDNSLEDKGNERRERESVSKFGVVLLQLHTRTKNGEQSDYADFRSECTGEDWVGGSNTLAEVGGDCDEKWTLSSGVLLVHGFFDVVGCRVQWRWIWWLSQSKP